MSVKRFVAADMRRALELVRQEMGPDAIILSSRRVKQGVEILTSLEPVAKSDKPSVHEGSGSQEVAMASDDAWSQQRGMEQAIATHVPAVPPVSRPAPRAAVAAQQPARGLASGKTSTQLAEEIELARTRMIAARKGSSIQNGDMTIGELAERSAPRREAMADTRLADTRLADTRIDPVVDDSDLDSDDFRHDSFAFGRQSSSASFHHQQQPRSQQQPHSQQQQLEQLQSDLADMRLLLEDQLNRIARAPATAANPMQASLERRLQRLGLPDALSQQLAARTREPRDIRSAWSEVLGHFSHNIPVMDDDIVARGGVFAFVGPTGVGKTTTIAKLAARYVLAHGADKVALITTDTCRIAAHEQLRTLARILNVQMRVVNDSEDLAQNLSRLRGCELVLIDTAGSRHGDPLLRQQMQTLQSLPAVQPLLVMSANSQMQMLKATLHAYQGAGLRGCVLTKLDETASLGEALGVIMERGLPLAYTTDGQEIPRDLSLAKAHQLVSRTIALAKAAQTESAPVAVAGIAGMNPAGVYTEQHYQPR